MFKQVIDSQCLYWHVFPSSYSEWSGGIWIYVLSMEELDNVIKSQGF